MFGTILRKLREDSGLTQSELAQALNLTDATIGNYEQGSRRPRNDTLKAIAKHFNVSVDYLLGFENTTTTDVIIKDYKTRVLYNGDDKLKIEIANLTKQILDNTDNTDTLVMLRDMLSGVCKK